MRNASEQNQSLDVLENFHGLNKEHVRNSLDVVCGIEKQEAPAIVASEVEEQKPLAEIPLTPQEVFEPKAAIEPEVMTFDEPDYMPPIGYFEQKEVDVFTYYDKELVKEFIFSIVDDNRD